MTANKNEKTVTSTTAGSTSSSGTKKRSSDQLIKDSETQYLKNRTGTSTTSTSSKGSTTSTTNSGKEVWARFLVYLKQPDEEADEEATK